ncbi:hypothetical protein MKS83_14510 [Chryseobacterium sp. Y16C]|uniref:hypothetical protein n=1 Tax=Chryseobacterium sp. Y16C TaxID=2920939 RepID=UPI001F0A5815|nr:hypothetical protein [Chryseobacterium sp. Y16C]UMQ40607.1 hypothetical protein MKS83_14510 [Chryseobacterium sp. Y16C]
MKNNFLFSQSKFLEENNELKTKTMKKLIIICISFILANSCSRSDSTESSDTNESNLIGVWKKSKEVIYSGQNNQVLATYYPADDCEKKSTSEFTGDGKLITKEFYLNSNNSCVSSPTQTKSYYYDSSTKKININNAFYGDILKLTTGEYECRVNYHYDHNGDGVDDNYVEYYYK